MPDLADKIKTFVTVTLIGYAMYFFVLPNIDFHTNDLHVLYFHVNFLTEMTAGQEKEEVTLRVLGTEEMGGHMTGSLSVVVVTEVGWTGTEAQTPETGAQTPEIAGNTDQTDAGQGQLRTSTGQGHPKVSLNQLNCKMTE